MKISRPQSVPTRRLRKDFTLHFFVLLFFFTFLHYFIYFFIFLLFLSLAVEFMDEEFRYKIIRNFFVENKKTKKLNP